MQTFFSIISIIRVQSPNKSYSLRSNTDKYLLQEGPPYNYRRTRGAFSIAAPKIWNKLPYKIRSVQKLSAFKSALKTHFLMKPIHDSFISFFQEQFEGAALLTFILDFHE